MMSGVGAATSDDVYQDVLDVDWSTIQPRTDVPMLRGRFVPTSDRVRLTVQVCGTMVAVSHANVQLFMSQEVNDGQPLTTGKVIPHGVKPGVDLHNIGSVWGDTSSTASRVLLLDGLRRGVPVAYEVACSIVGYCDQIPTARHPNGTAVAPGDRRLFVTCDGDDVLQRFELGRIMADHKDRLIDTLALPSGSGVCSPVVGADGDVVYVAGSEPARLFVVDVSARSMRLWKVVQFDDVATVRRVVRSASGDRLCVLGDDHKVIAVDSQSLAEQWRRAVPAATAGLAVTPDGDVVVCARTGELAVLSGTSGEVLDSTTVPGEPVDCAVNPVSGRMWVACRDGRARALEPKTLAPSVVSEEIVGLTGLAVDGAGQTVYGSMDAEPPQPTFVYFDDSTGVIFDRARLDSESRCPNISLSSDSFMYLPLEDVDKVWVFHGGTFFVRATSPFWCEHGSLIAEGARPV